jgi:hypothetical protein
MFYFVDIRGLPYKSLLRLLLVGGIALPHNGFVMRIMSDESGGV